MIVYKTRNGKWVDNPKSKKLLSSTIVQQIKRKRVQYLYALESWEFEIITGTIFNFTEGTVYFCDDTGPPYYREMT